MLETTRRDAIAVLFDVALNELCLVSGMTVNNHEYFLLDSCDQALQKLVEYRGFDTMQEVRLKPLIKKFTEVV